MFIVTNRRKATRHTLTFWLLFTVTVPKLCWYRTANIYVPTVEIDYNVMKGNVVL